MYEPKMTTKITNNINFHTSAKTNPGGCLKRFLRSDSHEIPSSDMKTLSADPWKEAGGAASLMVSAGKKNRTR